MQRVCEVANSILGGDSSNPREWGAVDPFASSGCALFHLIAEGASYARGFELTMAAGARDMFEKKRTELGVENRVSIEFGRDAKTLKDEDIYVHPQVDSNLFVYMYNEAVNEDAVAYTIDLFAAIPSVQLLACTATKGKGSRFNSQAMNKLHTDSAGREYKGQPVLSRMGAGWAYSQSVEVSISGSGARNTLQFFRRTSRLEVGGNVEGKAAVAAAKIVRVMMMMMMIILWQA